MDERERLVKLLIEGAYQEQGNVVPRSPYERLCEIADCFLSHGVTLPPCKVGDTVYQTDGERVYQSVVKKVIYDTDGIAFDETAIGTSVFLRREQAKVKAALNKSESEKSLQ